MIPCQTLLAAMMAEALAGEISPDQAAAITFAAMRAGQFYIFSHSEFTQPIRARAMAILQALPAR